MAEIMCPRCGSQTVIITSKEDNRRYYVCVNRPECKGRIAADEAAGYVWGEQRPVSIGAGGTWQQTETSSPSGSGPGVLRRLGEGVIGLRYVFKGFKRKNKTRSRDKKGKPHKPKQSPSNPRRREVQTMPGAYEVKGTSSPGLSAAPKAVEGKLPQRTKQTSIGRQAGWGEDWVDGAPARKTAVHKPRSYKVPQSAPREPEQVIKIQKVTLHKLEQPEAPQKEAAVERRVPPDHSPEVSLEEEIVPEKKAEDLDEKKPVRRWWQRIIGEEAPPEEKESPKIRRKEISVREVPLRKREEPLGPDVPQVPIERAPGRREEPAGPIPGGEVPYVPGGPLMAQPQMAQQSGMVSNVSEGYESRTRPKARPREAVYTGGRKPSKPRPQAVRREGVTSERKTRPGPARQVTKAPLAAHGTKRPARPGKPSEPEVYRPERAEEFEEFEPQEDTQSEIDAQKKRLLIMMVVTFIVFNLVIDGMLYALFMLR